LIDTTKLFGTTGLAGAVLSALLFTAACRGGSGATAAAPNGSAAPQAAFRECLRQHGITMPTGGPGGQGGRPGRPPSGRPTGRPSGAPSGGPPSATGPRQEGFQACASLAPNGGRFGGGVDQSALKAFQNCMSEHGVKVANTARPDALRTSDPKGAKAFQTCRPLLPQGPSGGPNPSTTPSA
jgi:hypothetical protein